MHSPPESSSGSQPAPAMLTPDSDSDSDSDDFGNHDRQQASIKLLPRVERGIEKTDAAFDGEGELDGQHDNEARLDEEGSEAYSRRESVETSHSYQFYTPDEERAVIRKFDRRLVALVAFLYMLSFLDRSNIGNAKIAGLMWDLGLSSDQYEWVLTAFYISYISFEWMSVLWKLVPPHIYVAVIVFSWGLFASLQSIVTNLTGLLILRLLLGIGEAGFTGIPFYLSFFFKRDELALRTGLFISAAPLATSFASTLSYLIVKISQYVPIAAWRLLFLLEGFPSIIVSLIAWYQIPDSPGKARYLSKRQKKVARLRLREERSTMVKSADASKYKLKELLETVGDPKTWITAIMFFCTNMAFASLPAYLPQILKDMGHSVLTSQGLSAPPYLISFFVVILTAYLSDRTRNRSYFIIFHALLSALGYATIAVAGLMHWSNWVRYIAIFPAAIGFFSVITIIITWNINNQKSESHQGIGFAMLQLIGQCGPLLGTRLYPDDDAPLYTRGMSVCCTAMILVAGLAWGLRLYLIKENRRGDAYDAVSDTDETLAGKTRFTYIV